MLKPLSPIQRWTKRGLTRIARTAGIDTDGMWLVSDVRGRLWRENFSVIFDVGANVGQSSGNFSADYPDARILAFEPSPQAFAILESVTLRYRHVRAFNIGFSDAPSMLRFDNSDDLDHLHRIANNQHDGTLPLVKMDTIDNFCREQEINAIDYLKIDTEGHDLNVLAGAGRMLGSAQIGLVEVECSMNRDNTYHVDFSSAHDLMQDHGYRLFGIYEQTIEFTTMHPHLRRANVAYISRQVSDRNRFI